MTVKEAGYSLLMVLVALGIFAVGITSLLALLPAGRESVRRTVFSSRSSAIAEREMARIRVLYGQGAADPPEKITGQEEDGFSWKAEIEKGDIYTIRLTVSWEKGKERRSETFQGGFYPTAVLPGE